MRKLHERLLNVAFCLVVAMVVMPTMADDTAMGFDMDSSIVYDDEVFSISEVIGMSNCVSDKRYESVIGLGRPFHGFTTVKLYECQCYE